MEEEACRSYALFWRVIRNAGQFGRLCFPSNGREAARDSFWISWAGTDCLVAQGVRILLQEIPFSWASCDWSWSYNQRMRDVLGRFYEFRERSKGYFETLKAINKNHGLEVGKFIKNFDRVFDQELRARHSIHHHKRFEDVAIDRIFLTEIISTSHEDKGLKSEHLTAHRKLASEWAERRGAQLDEFLEAIANATLRVCPFLLT
jgi:hypothetical protein